MSQGRKRNNRDSKKLVESDVTGVVKQYIDKGGYGFITEDDTNRDVFFHISAVSQDNWRVRDPILIGDEVIYDLFLAPKGYRAESVQILNQHQTSFRNEGGAGNRRRPRPRRRGGSGRNRRGDSVGPGHDERESVDGGWRVASGDRIPRLDIRSNGSTWRTRSTPRTHSPFDLFGQKASSPDDSKKGAGINKNPSGNGASFPRRTGVFPQGNSTLTSNISNNKKSDTEHAERKSSDTERMPQPPSGTHSPFDLFGQTASSPDDSKKGTGINRNTSGKGASFPLGTGVFFQGNSTGTPKATNNKKSDAERKSSDKERKPQPPSCTHSPFDLFGQKASSPDDSKKGAGINKNPSGNGASFPRRTGVFPQGNSTLTSNVTNNKKSDTEHAERKSSDAKAKPQSPPRDYSFFDLLGDKASNPKDAKKEDISKNPSSNGSSNWTGVSSEGSKKGTQNTSDTKPNMDRSDTKPNPQPKRRSAVYSYSYTDGSNRFSVQVENTDPNRKSSSSGASKQVPNNGRSAPRDGGNAKPTGDWKETTKGRYTKDDVKYTNKGPTTDELPNQQCKGPGGTTASKENPTSGSGNTSKADTKANTSTSASSLTRERGNLFFRVAREQRSDMVKSILYFKSALACYKKAYNQSLRNEDFVSAAKNAATTLWRLATIIRATGGASDPQVIHEYFKDALRYFSKASSKRNCRGQAWAKHLEKSIQDCVDDIKIWIAPKDEDERIAALKEYMGYLPACGAKINGHLHIAYIYFKRCKAALKFDEYEECQGYLKDCRIPLGEAEKMCADVDPSIRLNVNALKRNVEYHEGLVEKYKARVKDEKARQQRERVEESEKKIAMDHLKADMKALDFFALLPVENFVKQVYRRWPPKGSKSPNPPWSSSSSSSSSVASKKKLLIRAIIQYHPDKVDKSVHGIKWHLLSCEITKCLSMRLAEIK